MISKKEILEASQILSKSIHSTPLLESQYFNDLLEAQVYFKAENFQKTGSFKARGATNSILNLTDDQLHKGVATHSSGNHGQALAWAAKKQGIECWVVMPSNAPEIKKKAVLAYGAKVIECFPSLAAREEGLKEIQEETGATFIPPFNFHDTIVGQASVAFEVFKELPDLDYILAPVGGGGLLSGTALAAKYFSPQTKVIAGEPENANDAWQSFNEKKLIPVQNPNTIADGLKTSLGDLTFQYILEGVEEIFTCSEKEIIDSMQMVWERMKIVIEPSSAVPLACALKNKIHFKGKRLAIIISGGNVDLIQFFNSLKA